MSPQLLSRLALAATLALPVASSLVTGCGNDCLDAEVFVCNEDGEGCFCATSCSAHTDCETGRYCAEIINACVPLQSEQTTGTCGLEGLPCCVFTNAFGTVNACLNELTCSGTGVCAGDAPQVGWTSKLFFVRNECGAGAHIATRTLPGGVTTNIAYPVEVGDQVVPMSLWFGGAESGVALVGDKDGSSAHLLRYDATNESWASIKRFVGGDGSPFSPADLWGVMMRSDANGTVYIHSTQGLIVRVLPDGTSTVKTELPAGRLLEIDVDASPPFAVVCDDYGTCNRVRLDDMSVESGFMPWGTACYGAFTPPWAPPFIGALSYLVRCNDGVLECHDRSCQPISVDDACIYHAGETTRRFAWAGGAWETGLEAPVYRGQYVPQSEAGPKASFFRCDMAGPGVDFILPTASTELKALSLGPSGAQRGAIGLTLFDEDIEQRVIEYTLDPATGVVTEVEPSFDDPPFLCGESEPFYETGFDGYGAIGFVFYR